MQKTSICRKIASRVILTAKFEQHKNQYWVRKSNEIYVTTVNLIDPYKQRTKYLSLVSPEVK